MDGAESNSIKGNMAYKNGTVRKNMVLGKF